jgi:hypothetical protein
MIGDAESMDCESLISSLSSSGNIDLVPLIDVRDAQCKFDIDTNTGDRYLSIRAFCILHGIKIDRYKSQSIRAVSRKQSKNKGILMIFSESYGQKIYMYSESVLHIAFGK